MLFEELDADLQVRPLELAVHRFADIVNERGPDGRVRVESDFAGHDAGDVRDFLGMRQHILAVACAELEAAHHPVDLRMHVVQAQLERGRLAVLHDRLVDL